MIMEGEKAASDLFKLIVANDTAGLAHNKNLNAKVEHVTVLLPRGWVQEIKHM